MWRWKCCRRSCSRRVDLEVRGKIHVPLIKRFLDASALGGSPRTGADGIKLVNDTASQVGKSARCREAREYTPGYGVDRDWMAFVIVRIENETTDAMVEKRETMQRMTGAESAYGQISICSKFDFVVMYMLYGSFAVFRRP